MAEVIYNGVVYHTDDPDIIATAKAGKYGYSLPDSVGNSTATGYSGEKREPNGSSSGSSSGFIPQGTALGLNQSPLALGTGTVEYRTPASAGGVPVNPPPAVQTPMGNGSGNGNLLQLGLIGGVVILLIGMVKG